MPTGEGDRMGSRSPRQSVTRRAILALALTALLAGCYHPRPTVSPVPSIGYPFRAPSHSRTLVVFLPGMKSHGGDFERQGFVYTARDGGLEADLVEVDLHWGYYQDGSFVERLWEDVVRPARVSGYHRIWLVGISLGGSGALGFLREHPDALTGVVLLSPYLGPQELAEPIRGAGGLRRWKPAVTQPPKTFERFVEDNWGTLHRLTASKQAGPVLYLGYGNDEPMAPTLHLLADALPPARVLRVPGGHRWATWKVLWVELLQRQPFEEARGKTGPRRKPSR